MFSSKYFLDPSDLQYKRVRLPWKKKLIRFALGALFSVMVTMLYTAFINGMFGSPKEKALNQEIESLKLQYSMMGRELENSVKSLMILNYQMDTVTGLFLIWIPSLLRSVIWESEV